MKLPLLVSVPHAGVRVPAAARPYCRLSPQEIIADGDEGAAEMYALQEEFITRCHGRERPWVQVELSRAPFLANEEKRLRVLESLARFCRQVL